jgi:hypothetical protein
MSGALREAARRELDNPAPVGQRHAQILRLVPILRASGFSDSEIFFRLRANYDPDFPDSEISAVIEWAKRKIPVSGKNDFHRIKSGCRKNPFRAEKTSNRDFHGAIRDFLQGFSFGEADLFDVSPIRLPNDFRKDAELVFESLYSHSEKLNIVTQYHEQTDRTGNKKALPFGFGKTLSRNEWIDSFRIKSIPGSKAGAWFRINPTNGNGITDEDVSAFRFVLIESDLISPEIQISLFSKLPIPICAIVKSGGKSIHAWVRIAARNAGEFRALVGKTFFLLSPFGFDTSNRNPSRLSRLPGAQRTIGATEGGKQRLLYLNPEATERSIV